MSSPSASRAHPHRTLQFRGASSVLTGDNAPVSTCLCRQVGLPADVVLFGTEIEPMSEAELALAAAKHMRFAKLTPLHKERIVRVLRAQGQVVGFMGDGINDAPALRAADIGISVDSAADIILRKKSLLVLDGDVVAGRTTFCNMFKYIRMTAGSNLRQRAFGAGRECLPAPSCRCCLCN